MTFEAINAILFSRMAEILVVGAHPDDAEFGMGASIIKFIDQQKSVAICVLTRGERGTLGNTEERVHEMRRSAGILGAELDILSITDCQVFDTYENRLLLAEIIRKHRPKVVFTPYHTNVSYHRDGAAHPDHMAAGVLTKNAARYARFRGINELSGESFSPHHIIYYIVPRYMRPNLLVDVSDYIEKWEELLQCFASQLPLRDGNLSVHLKKLREANGMLAGVPYAEGFVIEEPILFEIDVFLNWNSR